MINWRGLRNITIIVTLIMMLCFLGINGQGVSEPVEPVKPVKEPVEEPVTRLNVTIIDEMSDQLIKLENCFVRVQGKLNIVEDVFNYTKTLADGDRYEITIHIRVKK